MTTRALIYTRTSSDRLLLRRSVSDQERDCADWCVQQGWAIAAVITDADRSASEWRTREREGFAQALEMIRTHAVDAFVTWEPSRAGREMAAYLELRMACRQADVLYLTQGRVYDFRRSDDAFLLGLEFLTAEKDAAMIRDRQLRTVRINAEKGRPHGRLPYGYRRVYDAGTGALLHQEVDPAQAQVIRRAAHDFLGGTSLGQIAYQLNHEGEPTPQPPRSEHPRGWIATTLRQILTNPTIASLRTYRGQVIGPAAWPAIIEPDQWRQLTVLLSHRTRMRAIHDTHSTAPKWLLSHIARCGFCERPLVRLGGKARRAPQYVCTQPGCRKIAVGLHQADQTVTQRVLAIIRNRGAALTSSSSADWLPRVTQAQELLAALKRRRQDAVAQHVAGRLDLNLLTDIDRELGEQISIAKLQARPPVHHAALASLCAQTDPQRAWDDLPLTQRRRLLKEHFDIHVHRANTRGAFDTDRIRVELRQPTP